MRNSSRRPDGENRSCNRDYRENPSPGGSARAMRCPPTPRRVASSSEHASTHNKHFPDDTATRCQTQ